MEYAGAVTFAEMEVDTGFDSYASIEEGVLFKNSVHLVLDVTVRTRVEAQVELSVYQALIQHAMTLYTDHGFGSHMNYEHC